MQNNLVQQAKDLIQLGYRRVSRRYRTVARIDRPDWLLTGGVAQKLRDMLYSAFSYYVRCSTTDKMEVHNDVMLMVPSADHAERVPQVEEMVRVIEAAVKKHVGLGPPTQVFNEVGKTFIVEDGLEVYVVEDGLEVYVDRPEQVLICDDAGNQITLSKDSLKSLVGILLSLLPPD